MGGNASSLHDSLVSEMPNRRLHYYVNMLDQDDSTYELGERNVPIDLEFEAHLQHEQKTGDMSNFLALLEMIPATKQKHSQPLLDFTKLKILTSRAYTEGCEHILAKREVPKRETQCKVAEPEATKEYHCKEKENYVEAVRGRREAHAAKVQHEQDIEERRATWSCRRWGGASPPTNLGSVC